MYGHRFVSAFGADPGSATGQVWAAGLEDLDDAALLNGISQVRRAGEKWPPGLPEFRALCLDVLTLDQVRANLRRRNDERHPFTRMVWAQLDQCAYTTGDDYRARAALADAYAAAREARMDGAPLPAPLAALPAGASVNPARAAMGDPTKMTGKGQQAIADLIAELNPRTPPEERPS